MKIAVIGAGIVGITTAYELAKDGHQVAVFERTGTAAEYGSFANAGLIAPSGLLHLSQPPYGGNSFTRFFKALRRLNGGAWTSGRKILWLWKWSQSASTPGATENRAQLRNLGLLSLQRAKEILSNENLECEQTDGQLILLRSATDLQMMAPYLRELKDAGVAYRELTEAEARSHELALASSADLHSAVFLPDDAVINCRQFAMLLKNAAQKMGVAFNFSCTIKRISPSTSGTLDLEGNENSYSSFDQVVVCAGSAAQQLLVPLKIDLPIASLHSYSLSVPVREPLNAPKSAVADFHKQTLISRLGGRIRVCGGTEWGSDSAPNNKRVVGRLYKTLDRHFPGAANYPAGTQVWRGAICATPDGVPVIGASGVQGLWLNLGHGPAGWTLACGAAKLLADQISGRSPTFNAEKLAPNRFL